MKHFTSKIDADLIGDLEVKEYNQINDKLSRNVKDLIDIARQDTMAAVEQVLNKSKHKLYFLAKNNKDLGAMGIAKLPEANELKNELTRISKKGLDILNKANSALLKVKKDYEDLLKIVRKYPKLNDLFNQQWDKDFKLFGRTMSLMTDPDDIVDYRYFGSYTSLKNLIKEGSKDIDSVIKSLSKNHFIETIKGAL